MLAVCLLAAPAFGQTFSNIAIQNGPGGFLKAAPFAPVYLCQENATSVAGCSLQTLYTNSSLGTPISPNAPTVSDGSGNFTFYAQPGKYTICIVGVTTFCQNVIVGATGGGVAGSNTQVQFNDNGQAGGDAGLTFDKTTGNFGVQGPTAGTDFNITLAGRSGGGLNPINVHSPFANGLALFTHSDSLFRAPFISFSRSKGTQSSPTAITVTGFESTGIGGLSFQGYDGTSYVTSSFMELYADENWAAAGNHHGSHIEFYTTFNGSASQQERFQIGGFDSSFTGVQSNNITYLPLSFGGNASSNAMLKAGTSGGAPAILLRAADDSGDASFTARNIVLTGGTAAAAGTAGYVSLGNTTVSALPAAAAGNVGQIIKVSDSTAVASEGQTCVGSSTNTALAFSNGTVWKCF